MKIHITKQGETLDHIAQKYAVSSQDLTGINAHVNATSELIPGLKLKIPMVDRTKQNASEGIEQFYPNLEQEKQTKEQAVPIGIAPFPEPNPHIAKPDTIPQQHQTMGGQPHPEHTKPWSHFHDTLTENKT